jgi:integrase
LRFRPLKHILDIFDVRVTMRNIGGAEMAEERSSEKTRYPGIYKVTRSTARGTTVRYVVSYRVRGIGQRTKPFEHLADAKEFQGRMRDPAQGARMRRRVKGRQPLAEYFPAWLEGKRRLRESTRRRYGDIGTKYIAPFRIGRMNVSDIEHVDVKDWITELVSKGVPAPTIDKAHRTLRACLSSAVADGMADANAASRAETPEQDRRDPFFLSAKQVDAIASEVPDRNRALVYFLAYTGARVGEATALRVKNLDLLRRRVTIAESSAEVGGRKLEPGKTKSGDIRTVPIFEDLATELAAHLDRYGKQGKDGELDREAFVFSSSHGTVVRQNNWRSRVFQPAARRANVTRPGKDGKVEVPRVHDLRHTFASLAAESGYTLHEVKEMLGHSTIQITSDLYLHLFPDTMAEKAERLGAAMRDARKAGTVTRLTEAGA